MSRLVPLFNIGDMIQVKEDDMHTWARGAIFEVKSLEEFNGELLVKCILQHDLLDNGSYRYTKGETFNWYQKRFESIVEGLCADCSNGCKVNNKEKCDFHEQRRT